MSNKKYASDFEKLMEIQSQIDQYEKQQEDLLKQLLEAEEELSLW